MNTKCIIQAAVAVLVNRENTSHCRSKQIQEVEIELILTEDLFLVYNDLLYYLKILF